GLLTGCQTTGSTNPDSIWYELPTGSKLVLYQDLEIPAGQAHTIVQNAKAGTSAYKLEVMCRFEVEQLGPRTIHPDTFLITEVAQGRQWVNEPSTLLFYKDLHLQSEQQQAILPMRCGYTDDPLLGEPVTIEQIRETLGRVFTLVPGPGGVNPQ
ncbi:MAG: hypothetical protein WCH04_18620, partial [Gammaproteobacteria bacterium]